MKKKKKNIQEEAGDTDQAQHLALPTLVMCPQSFGGPCHAPSKPLRADQPSDWQPFPSASGRNRVEMDVLTGGRVRPAAGQRPGIK